MFRLLFAALLVAHGLIHVSFLTPAPVPAGEGPPWPFDLNRSWLLTRLGVGPSATVAAGRGLVVALVAAFTLAAIGVLLGASWWEPVTIVAAVLSLVQLTVWFHWWLPVGALIDVALIAGLTLDWWPRLESIAR